MLSLVMNIGKISGFISLVDVMVAIFLINLGDHFARGASVADLDPQKGATQDCQELGSNLVRITANI
jgi:hypothetical protein